MNQNAQRKKIAILSTIALVLIATIIIGATFAYFTNRVDDTKSIDATIKSRTTDSQVFSTGDKLSIYATSLNFGSGSDSLFSITSAKTSLRANNVDGHAERSYFVYLNVSANTFEYTTDLRKPELLLQVTDPDGNEFGEGDIFGLEYRTVIDNKAEEYSGFDITTFSGIVPLASNYIIESTSSSEEVTQEWKVKVIFVNLTDNQSRNQGHSLTGELIIDKEADTTGTVENCTGLTFEDCMYRYIYRGQGVDGLYYHNSGNHDNYLNSKYEANDYSLRYAGGDDEVNNWVCFGYTSESACKNDDFTTSSIAYRIIGLFRRDVTYTFSDNGSSYPRTIPEYNVKLIRQNTTYNSTRSNVNFDAYNTSLNDSDWMKMIENYYPYLNNDFYSSGWTLNFSTARTLFNSDMSVGYVASSKVSSYNTSTPTRLMYASDYGYAASPYYWEAENTWETALSQYSRAKNENNNWLYIGKELTKVTNTYNDYAWVIDTNGSLKQVSRYSETAVYRPTIYLKHGTKYKSGTGTKNDPYILEYGISYESGTGTDANPYIPVEES